MDWALVEEYEEANSPPFLQTNQLVEYAENTTICRHELLRAYFEGTEPGSKEAGIRCTSCDVCKSSEKVLKLKMDNLLGAGSKKERQEEAFGISGQRQAQGMSQGIPVANKIAVNKSAAGVGKYGMPEEIEDD